MTLNSPLLRAQMIPPRTARGTVLAVMCLNDTCKKGAQRIPGKLLTRRGMMPYCVSCPCQNRLSARHTSQQIAFNVRIGQKRLSTSIGAGTGNRTHVASFEGWSSTIELHPHQQKE